MSLPIEVEQEENGRWLAEIPELPGVMAYEATPAEAVARVRTLGFRVLADRVERGEAVPTGFVDLFEGPA